jgi:UDP-3-O-[3-hydroxymyristoyl] glucosamine N-acyltransferase
VYDYFATHSITMKLSQIASALDVRLENGSPDTEISGLNGIEHAGPGELTFVSNPKYAAAARSTTASAVIVGEDFPAISAAMLRAKDPYLTFARALELFHQPLRYAPGIHATAVIHASARIGANAHIGPYVVVDENVEVGANAVLLAQVVIYRGVKIGNNFFAHAHAVVRCKTASSSAPTDSDSQKLRTDIGTRFRSPPPSSLKTTWKCRPTPASTAPASAKPALDAA